MKISNTILQKVKLQKVVSKVFGCKGAIWKANCLGGINKGANFGKQRIRKSKLLEEKFGRKKIREEKY